MTDKTIRYAVYIRNKKTDETFSLSSSWQTLSAAQDTRDHINRQGTSVEAIIIRTWMPEPK